MVRSLPRVASKRKAATPRPSTLAARKAPMPETMWRLAMSQRPAILNGSISAMGTKKTARTAGAGKTSIARASAALSDSKGMRPAIFLSRAPSSSQSQASNRKRAASTNHRGRLSLLRKRARMVPFGPIERRSCLARPDTRAMRPKRGSGAHLEGGDLPVAHGGCGGAVILRKRHIDRRQDEEREQSADRHARDDHETDREPARCAGAIGDQQRNE